MSTQLHEESPDNSHRRDRAAIAAQACQTCRNRKSKCDEQRPKCGLCKRVGVDCVYREAQPTKKDKTMVEILDIVRRLETKIDSGGLQNNHTTANTHAINGKAETPSDSLDQSMHNNAQDFAPQSPHSQHSSGVRQDARATQEQDLTPESPYSQHSSGVRRGVRAPQEHEFPKELERSLGHLTAAHKIILWPAIYEYIQSNNAETAPDLQPLLTDGTPWTINLELKKHPSTLPCNSLPASLIATRPHAGVLRSGFFGLNPDRVFQLTEAYFGTFNIIQPILDREFFVTDVIEPITRYGFLDSDIHVCLALLVFALGQVALDGVHGPPVSAINGGNPSGIRGGTVEHPPGLEIFNEARKRIGFVMHQCSLENVQVFLLQATYYESCARHMDFWRSTVNASMSCQVLIRCKLINWASERADLIKRAYWSCILSEDFLHLELDLPQTGIATLEDQVPLPYFHDAQSASPTPALEERSHFQYHFLAMIALRRVITRIHGSIHQVKKGAESAEDYGGPPVHVIKELGRQLESWRELLPAPIRWSDDNRFDFANLQPGGPRPAETLFTLNHGPVPIKHRYNLDIVTGQLRTRFYYARFMMYRPFVFKALHFPEMMNAEDIECCALAIKSACLWPLSMAPCDRKKRLVPHLFTWTQNFLGILLILRMAAVNPYLKALCDARVNTDDMQNTVVLLLDWMRDMRQVDGVAEWSWKLLGPLYSNL